MKESKAEFYEKSSELFENEVYLEEVSDVLCIAQAGRYDSNLVITLGNKHYHDYNSMIILGWVKSKALKQVVVYSSVTIDDFHGRGGASVARLQKEAI